MTLIQITQSCGVCQHTRRFRVIEDVPWRLQEWECECGAWNKRPASATDIIEAEAEEAIIVALADGMRRRWPDPAVVQRFIDAREALKEALSPKG